MFYLSIKHNIEVAHRLWNTPGKCEQIHGHSMWVTLHLAGDMGPDGMLVTADGPLEFGKLKKAFRGYLDSHYDHRLLLNASDPFSRPIFMTEKFTRTISQREMETTIRAYEIEKDTPQQFLPGLQSTPGDPTTENIALWIGEHSQSIGMPVMSVEVWETSVNCAVWMPDQLSIIDQRTVQTVHRLEQEGRL